MHKQSPYVLYILTVMMCGPLIMHGCGPPKAPLNERLTAVNANERIGAILEVARNERRDLIPELVVCLEDEDPAARMYAILTLEKLTGTRLGYAYSDSIAKRRAAVKRWQRYAQDLPAATNGHQERTAASNQAREASEGASDPPASH